MSNIYEIEVETLDGEKFCLSRFSGQVLLIVNVASKCGFTPQYAELEQLYKEFSSRGFSVLGFPCNQFGNQEPGDSDAIRSFCSLTYNVTFPIFKKIDVNGSDAHPLYVHLKSTMPGLLGTEMIKWNFTKFLVDRSGNTKKRLAPTTSGKELRAAVESVLVEDCASEML